MANAGFHKIKGSADSVECVFCKVTYRDWKKTDDPYVKHIELSPNCMFALQKKPQDDMEMKTFIECVYNSAHNQMVNLPYFHFSHKLLKLFFFTA